MVISVPAQMAEERHIRNKIRRHDTRLQAMQRFERTLQAHLTECLSLPELSAKIGVSTRTLRTYCRKSFGMSPHKYLWMRRMNLVRWALTLADPTAVSVTAIATSHGFWELGRFAVAYRRLFGESPSVTLRRARNSNHRHMADSP